MVGVQLAAHPPVPDAVEVCSGGGFALELRGGVQLQAWAWVPIKWTNSDMPTAPQHRGEHSYDTRARLPAQLAADPPALPLSQHIIHGPASRRPILAQSHIHCRGPPPQPITTCAHAAYDDDLALRATSSLRTEHPLSRSNLPHTARCRRPEPVRPARTPPVRAFLRLHRLHRLHRTPPSRNRKATHRVQAARRTKLELIERSTGGI
ncbi:hypothetical protein BDV96DRAFT_281592 [Lophiotrema nucula]|uniref:Uncharacterized protein n=1 Tax=Lophiotrema nucula TaxID=690887 RepID=A0A6A5ZMU8_9PLEO|nr:hypothetical protein BDV96DRAFT_281592 [Lophiotrema nucula]